jgi:SAM-dependent methyltransferase
MHQKEVRLIKQEVGGSKTVLEVGCGTGRLSVALLQKNTRIIGLDISETMLQRTRKRSKELNLLLGDAGNLPFRNESIESVFSAYTINHIPNYRKALSEMCRIASHYVIIIVPYFLGVLVLISLILNPIRKLLGRLKVFSRYFFPSDISKVLKTNRLNVKQRGLYLIPPKVVNFNLLPYFAVKILEKLNPILDPLLLKLFSVQVSVGTKSRLHE